MNYINKTCPHCQAQLQPSEGAFELVRRGMAGSESPPGLPVSLYSCPQCGYLELYNLRVIGQL